MNIENRSNAQRIKLVFFALPFLFVFTVGPLIIFDISSGFEIIVTLAVVIALLYIALNFLDFNYLNISIDKKKLHIKYFGLAPLNKEYKRFQIKAAEVYGYEIKPSFFGLKKMLVVFRKDRGELFKYPPVNINALNKRDTEQLIKGLELLTNINKRLT
ncbi:MAG: hypothetical protein R6U85_00695 [Salinivirgaceae bacterium]|jgi:hypothetical protein